MNPIFDEVLADSDPDIFLASNIFPNPTVSNPGWIEKFPEFYAYFYPPLPPLQPIDPANLSFLGG